MLTGVISYPIPPYSNLPIEPQFYLPSRFVISAISLGQSTTVTTTVNHNYVIGQLVRLLIPSVCKTIELNEQEGFVTSIPSPNQVVLNINSSGFNSFVNTSSISSQPQILAIGDTNTGATNSSGRNSTGTFIPGSFINISPL